MGERGIHGYVPAFFPRSDAARVKGAKLSDPKASACHFKSVLAQSTTHFPTSCPLTLTCLSVSFPIIQDDIVITPHSVANSGSIHLFFLPAYPHIAGKDMYYPDDGTVHTEAI